MSFYRKDAAKKKAAAKKAPARKAAPKKAPAKKVATTAIKSRWSKTEILNEISAATDLSRKQVSDVLDHLTNSIERHIKKGSVGEFVLPGLFKINTKKKPAQRARKGINPFTGLEQMFKAKPATKVVKVSALKGLKDMV